VSGHQPIAEWPEPLTVPQLAGKLRELAEVAVGDGGHDFGTVFDSYSSAARLACSQPLSLAECQQILRAVRDSIPETGTWRSDLMALNKHLFERRSALGSEAAQHVLPQLFRATACRIESPSAESQEGRR
jgi:hypothetical protein